MSKNSKVVDFPTSDAWADGAPVEEEASAPAEEIGAEEASAQLAEGVTPGEASEERAGGEEAPAPDGPPATPADGVFEPDQTWLTNPAPENEDEIIKQKDDARLSQLRADRRLLILEAREHLKAPGAITGFVGSSKGESHKYKSFSIYNERTSLRKVGNLTIKIKLRMSQIDPHALSKYLAHYANFKGTGQEAVTQIAHDIYILLRCRSVDVSLTIHEIDSEVTYTSGEEWG